MTLRINDNGTDRDMTENEIKEYEAWQIIYAKEKAAETKTANERAKAKTALLTKLGITADEAALLLS
tara:strand:- start:29 stop:229 length:201 start_codon:yes stop_codon:yes gene_type:complete